MLFDLRCNMCMKKGYFFKRLMPEKAINARAINPVVIKVMPIPFSPSGISE